jgi:hypothetical protein
MSGEGVRRYLSQGFEQVPGWCHPRIMEITGLLADEMSAAGVIGGACEIGVYQGKFIIGLAHAVDGRPSLAIDLFDGQESNVDGSGGDIKRMLTGFRKNVERFGYASLVDMAANSFALTIRDRIAILDRFGPFQLFSIDGGHTAEHVVNDYKFAEDVTHHGGAIIIDDINNAGWPGVMEGVAHVFFVQKPKFVPLLMGYNKLVLVGLTHHKRYLAGLETRITADFPDQKIWHTKFFGYEMLSVF